MHVKALKCSQLRCIRWQSACFHELLLSERPQDCDSICTHLGISLASPVLHTNWGLFI